MKVYLFRHGEVENPEKVLYGRLPGFHLSEKGKNQVLKTSQKLIGKEIKQIYSSPLERAVETAQVASEILGLDPQQIVIDDRLIESDLSKWQGTDVEEFRKKVVFELSPRTQTEFELIINAGARILSVLNGPIKQSGEDTVVVSHGDPLTGCMINITGDWSFIEGKYVRQGEKIIKVETKYIKKGEFVVLELDGDNWNIIGRSY
jgi:broad specificity phosphatase PhoE